MAILAVEVLIILKFSKGQFPQPTPPFVWVLWVIVGGSYVLVCLLSITRLMRESDNSEPWSDNEENDKSKME